MRFISSNYPINANTRLNVAVDHVVFDGNTARQSGGAVVVQAVKLAVDDSLFVNNSATHGSGGAVYSHGYSNIDC